MDRKLSAEEIPWQHQQCIPQSLDLKNFSKSLESSTTPSEEQFYLQPARKLLKLKPSPVLNAAYNFLPKKIIFFFPEEYIAYFKAGGLQERFRAEKLLSSCHVLLAFSKFRRNGNPMITLLSLSLNLFPK